MGDLYIRPKLVESQFDDEGRATLTTTFASRRLSFQFNNRASLPVNRYRIGDIRCDGIPIEFEQQKDGGVLIERSLIKSLAPEAEHSIVVTLLPKPQSSEGVE